MLTQERSIVAPARALYTRRMSNNCERKNVMRTQFASGSMIETVVTLAAAVLMTVAGFAMIEDTSVTQGGATLVGPIVVAPDAVATPQAAGSQG